MKSKYKGIDEREVKCCCHDEVNCCESGISFEDNLLRFHFLEHMGIGDKKFLNQRTKSMVLNKRTAEELIKQLNIIANGI